MRFIKAKYASFGGRRPRARANNIFLLVVKVLVYMPPSMHAVCLISFIRMVKS